MDRHTKISILLLIVALNSITSALEARKVLHIPEKIIGGVIDIVQSHKNKPVQVTAIQGQTQQQVNAVQGQAQQQVYQQYAPWYQGQGQVQYQGQYGNYGYPQSGINYGQGGYVNQGYGGSQSQPQSQYPIYPQNQLGNQFQGVNQQTSGSFESQQNNQFQNGIQGQGQQNQVQGQNQQFQNQNQQQSGQFVNQNQPASGNFQGFQQAVNQNYQNQPSNGFVAQQTGIYGNQQHSNNFASNQQSAGNFVGHPSNNYVGQNQPQGQVTQSSFVGQNHQSTLSQGQTAQNGLAGATGSNSGSYQISTGHYSGGAVPTCLCQAWTKPQAGVLNDNPAQRSEEPVEKSD